jgi:hypothetical protein
MGVGEIDDLSGIGRVSYHFLVSAQDGVKHHLAGSDIDFCPYQFSFERSAINEHQRTFANFCHLLSQTSIAYVFCSLCVCQL